MADLSITAASVVAGTGATQARGTTGANITAGQCVYLDSSNLLQLADANDTAVKSLAVGIALHGSLSGQPLAYVTAGPITIGAATTNAMPYCVSNTAGGICPITDKANTDYLSILGYSNTNGIIIVSLLNTNTQLGADIT